MKLLLIGRTGQVGYELQRSLAPLGDLTVVGRAELDMSHGADIDEVLNSQTPDIVVNASAYTAVDKAESEIAAAEAVNGAALARLASYASRSGAILVHYSTDYVFSGREVGEYTEDSATEPQNVYGRTKLEGERAIVAAGCDHLIFRTSWVHGRKGANFVRTILRLAGEREELRVVDDQIGAPTGAELIADVTAHCLRTMVADRTAGGLYHLTASGRTNWYEYARFITDHARGRGAKLRIDAANIKPTKSADYPQPATRPKNSVLDTGKLRNRFNLTLPDWRIGVIRTVDDLMERP